MVGIHSNKVKQPTANTDAEISDAISKEAMEAGYKDLLKVLKAIGTSVDQDVVKTTVIAQEFSKTLKPESNFATKKSGDPITFKNNETKNSLTVKKGAIEFTPAEEKNPFTYADAMGMAELAALDTNMHSKEGVTLTGTKQERALLQRAIKEVNNSLPKDKQIKVKNKLGLLRPAKDFSEKPAKEYAKSHNTNFKRTDENPLKPAKAVATPAPKATPVPAEVNKQSLLSDDVYQNLTEHIQSKNSATNATITEFLKASGDIKKGTLTASIKEARSRLAEENFVKAVPHGKGTRLIINLKSDFEKAGVNTKPPTATAEDPAAGIERTLNRGRNGGQPQVAA